MSRPRRRVWFFALFFTILFIEAVTLVLMNQTNVWAATDSLDAAAGVDQSFTIGRAQKEFGRTFHEREVYGLPREPEGTAGEWVTTRKITVRGAYDSNLFSEYHDPKQDFIHTYTT